MLEDPGVSAEVRSAFNGTLSDELKAAFNGVFLVARRDGVPVACGGMLFLDDATCELRRVYVRPEERGSGVARALMAELERAASERGMLADTAGDGRPPAQGDALLRDARLQAHTAVRQARGQPVVRLLRETHLPDGITFEPATPDVPEVARLLAAYEKEFLSFNTREETGWRGEAAHQGLAMLLVRRDRRPVGCGALRMRDAVTAELKRMYVVPAERGRGIATELVARLEGMALERGATRMVLDTTPRMASAVRLYERLGYVPTEPFGAPAPALVYYEKRLG